MVNIITGCWKTDTYRLKTMPDSLDLVRKTIPAGRYFQHASYQGSRERARWPEKLLAIDTYFRIRALPYPRAAACSSSIGDSWRR